MNINIVKVERTHGGAGLTATVNDDGNLVKEVLKVDRAQSLTRVSLRFNEKMKGKEVIDTETRKYRIWPYNWYCLPHKANSTIKPYGEDTQILEVVEIETAR